jgi:hypothetical protein
LKQDGLIDDEAQIQDPNEVAVAAVHATAWIIVNPIARSTEEREQAKEMFDNFIRELNKVKIDVDLNKDGVVEPLIEEDSGNIFLARG